MIVIGLTGSLGTGKSTVGRMLARHKARVIDADKIAHALIQPGQPCFREIIKHFGRGILRGGRIDRKKLAGKVFRDKKQLRVLEGIIHPRVIGEIRREVAFLRRQKNVTAVVLDVPLLFESGLSRMTDFNITVWVPQNVQLKRLCRDNRMTRQEALRRILAQMPLRRKARLSDYIIDNHGSLTQTRNQVTEIWRMCINKEKDNQDHSR